MKFRSRAVSLLLCVAAGTVNAAAYPSSDLVSLDNPNRAAIVRHEIVASIDPATHGLRAKDSFVVVHAPGVSASDPVALLLWRDLKPAGPARSPLGDLTVDEPPRFNPRDFWHRPPFDELDGYEHAREWKLSLGGAANATWPETLRIELAYEGTVMDSLRPPKEAYGRSFELTAGLIEQRGAYLASTSFWIPTRPDDVYTFSLEATSPSGWRAVTQGDLISPLEVAAAAPSVDRWECPRPMQEIYLVAGPWSAHELVHRGVRCMAFTHADTDSSIYNRYLRGTGRYLDLYGDAIGPYAFSKFALVENFWQSGYGMPSFTLLGDRVIRLPFILDTSYGHEILHNWWGNGVFVESNEGNWCEGLTVYGADYLYKEREGADAARQYRLDALKGYLNDVGEGRDFALRAFRERNDAASASIGYSKSMMVLHQVRRAVGNDAFNRGLQDFYRENLWHRASWLDLLRAIGAQAAPGVFDADAYAARWIDQAGAPSLRLSDCGVDRTPSGATSVHGRIEIAGEALQDAILTGKPVEPGAALGADIVPLRVSMKDGSAADFAFPLRSGGFRVEVTGDPISLSLDPDFEVMRKLDHAEIPVTIGQTLGADSITVVYAADLSKDQRAAWDTLVKGWDKARRVGRVEESQMPSDWVPATGAFLLGFGRTARRLTMDLTEVTAPTGPKGEWTIAGEPYPVRSSVILTGSIPGSADLSWTLLQIPEASLITTVDGKVPHYSKYSWLVFKGPDNVGKGSWTHTLSPLTVRLD